MPTYNPIVQYFNHSVSIDGFLTGVQSISVDQSSSANKLTEYGRINNLKVIRPKPETRISITRPLDNTNPPFLLTGDGDILTYLGGVSTWDNTLKTYDIEFDLNREAPDSTTGKMKTGGSSLKFRKYLLSEARYSFSADSTFAEEQLSFSGFTIEKGNGATTSFGSADTGNVIRRHNFKKSGCTFPLEIQSLFDNSSYVLREVNIGISFNWNNLANFGEMNAYKYRYLSFPIDITCSITLVDLKFDQPGNNDTYINPTTYSMSDILFTDSDFTPNRTIVINAGNKIWDLGSKNYFVSRSRKGGEAGSNSYSTYTYEYKNSENFIKIKSET